MVCYLEVSVVDDATVFVVVGLVVVALAVVVLEMTVEVALPRQVMSTLIVLPFPSFACEFVLLKWQPRGELFYLLPPERL
jgi:hypothetical protein